LPAKGLLRVGDLAVQGVREVREAREAREAQEEEVLEGPGVREVKGPEVQEVRLEALWDRHHRLTRIEDPVLVNGTKLLELKRQNVPGK